MRVVTIDGGFRGLGDVAPSVRNAAVADFTRAIAPLDDMLERYIAFRAAGNISESDDLRIMDRYHVLSERIAARLRDAEGRLSESAIAAWSNGNAVYVNDVRLWINDVRRIMGDEIQNRGLRTFLIAAASITVLGGGMYVIYQATKGKKR